MEEKNKKTNKHGLGLAPSARGGSLWQFLCIVLANASVYLRENTHKATIYADLSSRVDQPGICRSTDPSSRLSDFCWLVSSVSDSHLPDWPVLSTGICCPLLLTASFSWLPLSCRLSFSGLTSRADWSLGPSFPRLVGNFARRTFVWGSRQNRKRDSLTGTHIHRNRCHRWCHTRVLNHLMDM